MSKLIFSYPQPEHLRLILIVVMLVIAFNTIFFVAESNCVTKVLANFLNVSTTNCTPQNNIVRVFVCLKTSMVAEVIVTKGY